MIILQMRSTWRSAGGGIVDRSNRFHRSARKLDVFILFSWKEETKQYLYIMLKVGNLFSSVIQLARSIGCRILMYKIDGQMILIFVGFSS
jgi:hypothetical protein